MRKFTSLMLMLLCAVTTWGAIRYSFGTAPATTLTSGKYVLMAMCSHGTGPVYYNAAEGGNRLYRLDNGVTFNAGDEVNANYVWTLTLNDDGTFTLENVEDGKFFVKDAEKNKNFQGTETAVLAAEEHTINETQYFALHLANETDKANIGYIHANAPGGNPNLSYWNTYADDGTCIKFQFYPVTEIEVSLDLSNGSAYSDGWKVADWAKPENTSTMEDILAAFHNSSIDAKYENITADDVWVATREINISEAGTLAATITYSDGGKRLDLGGADVIDSEGNVVASDYHSGYAGGSTNSNTFVMDIPEAGTYTLRYIATFKFETNQSWGPVAITYNTNPYANKYFFIQEANQNSLVIDVKNFGTNQASIEKKDYSKNQIFQIYAAADSKYYLKTMSGHAIGTSGWDNNIQAGPTTSYMLTQVEGEEYYTIADAANHGFGTSNIAAGENVWTDHYPGKGGSANCYWNIIELTDDELALRSQYEEAVLIKNDLQTIIATANKIKENGFGEKIGQFVNSEKATFETAIAAAQNVLDNLTSNADGKNAITTLQEAIDALTFNLPEDGKFYVMRSASEKEYCKDAYVLGHAAPKEHVDAVWGNQTYDHRHLYFTKDLTIETTPIAIFQFNGNNGEYKVKNVHTNTFIKSFGKDAEHLGDEASAGTITLKSLRDGTGSVSVWKSGEADPMHAQEAYTTIVGWGAEPGNPSTWYVEEVETFAHVLNVTEVGYSTLMLGFDATIPAGVECYYAAEAIDENGVLNLTKIETGILPANTAVVVKLAEDSEAGDHKFTYSATAGTAVEGNLLSGTLYTKNVTPAENTTYYVLANGDEGVGLYPDALSEGIFRNNANKAYLPVVVESGSTAPSYSFNFDWAGTTGIEGVTAEGAQDGAIYDITGRRVKAITAPGIYIVNGKKVVK